ncbi:hypothetical protein LP419_39550 [Massilia sp. H-1]|nr:hypothetical protein LP419_39550 [Massilia sp. H-1]
MSAVASLASLASKSNTDTDAAIASVILFSDAYARVSGNADIDVTGAFVLSATNAVISTAIADGTASGMARPPLACRPRPPIPKRRFRAAQPSMPRRWQCALRPKAPSPRPPNRLPHGATDDGNGGTQTKSQTALSTNNAEARRAATWTWQARSPSAPW